MPQKKSKVRRSMSSKSGGSGKCATEVGGEVGMRALDDASAALVS
jgi:hypothetical protein